MQRLSCTLGLLGAFGPACACDGSKSFDLATTQAEPDILGVDVAGSAVRAADEAHAADAIVLTDPQIAGVIEAVNDGEIEQALLALGASHIEGGAPVDSGFDAGLARSANATVVMFAGTTIAQHSRSNATIAELGISPTPSGVQAALRHEAQVTVAQLFPLLGSGFDVAYVESQVTAHTAMRDVIEHQLIPAARNEQLKLHLCGTLLPVVETHLAEARALFALLTSVRSLEGASSSSSAGRVGETL